MQRRVSVQGLVWWLLILVSSSTLLVGFERASAQERPALSAAGRPVIAKHIAVRGTHEAPRLDVTLTSDGDVPVVEPAREIVEPAPKPRRLRRLTTHEVSPDMLQIAARLIREHHRDKPGTEIPFESGGQPYVARVERHYHPEGGPVHPWGYHPGISLFVER